jgi:hypothetical protein
VSHSWWYYHDSSNWSCHLFPSIASERFIVINAIANLAKIQETENGDKEAVRRRTWNLFSRIIRLIRHFLISLWRRELSMHVFMKHFWAPSWSGSSAHGESSMTRSGYWAKYRRRWHCCAF